MPNILKFSSVYNSIQLNRVQTLAPIISLYSCCRFSTNPPSNLVQNVAIFWDLDSKPPKSISVFDAAIGLKKAATSFGFVKHMLAYGSVSNSVSYVPVEIRGQRKGRMALNKMQNTGVVKPVEPSFCRVCGRRFYDNDKLVNHFTQIHVPEQKKRLNQIESARGSRRVKLAGKFAMKMHKFRTAERDILMPKVGGGLAGELEKTGFWVRIGREAVSVGLRNCMVEMMGRRRVECVVLVSGNEDFVDVLKEARARCVRTVSVGDRSDGVLKRTADAAFSWQEIMLDKAKKEAVSVVGRWKDHDVLKSLEWTYNPEFDNSSSSH